MPTPTISAGFDKLNQRILRGFTSLPQFLNEPARRPAAIFLLSVFLDKADYRLEYGLFVKVLAAVACANQ